MDGFQGAVLGVKLPYLTNWNQKRRDVASRYLRNLATANGLVLPVEAEHTRHVYHLFVVRHPRRDDLGRFLTEHGVDNAVHYPHPLHLTPAFSSLGYTKGDFTVTERCCGEISSLPIFPELEDEQIDYVCGKIHRFAG